MSELKRIDPSMFGNPSKNRLNVEDSELIKEVKSNPILSSKIKELELSDKEILKYYSILSLYGEEQKLKETCPGIDDCILPSPHMLSDLVRKDGVILREAKYCPCYQRIGKIKMAYKFADFDPSLFEKIGITGKALITEGTIHQALLNAKKEPSKHWTFINDVDHIALKYVVSYCNKMTLKTNQTIAVVDYVKFIEDLKLLPYDELDEKTRRIDVLKEVGILVLLNFGSEVKSDLNRDSILMPILRERAIKKAETILLSAFSRTDIRSLYTTSSISSKVATKELENILTSNIAKSIVVKAGVEENF